MASGAICVVILHSPPFWNTEGNTMRLTVHTGRRLMVCGWNTLHTSRWWSQKICVHPLPLSPQRRTVSVDIYFTICLRCLHTLQVIYSPLCSGSSLTSDFSFSGCIFPEIPWWCADVMLCWSSRTCDRNAAGNYKVTTSWCLYFLSFVWTSYHSWGTVPPCLSCKTLLLDWK